MTREEAADVIQRMKNGMAFSDEENDNFWSYTYNPGTKKFEYLEAWTVIGSVTAQHNYEEADFVELLVSKFTYREVTGCAFTRGSSSETAALQSAAKAAPPQKVKPQTVAEAVDVRDWESLAALLQNGAKVPPHSAGTDGPIHYAAMFGTANAVKLLLEHGAPADIPGSYRRTPLMYAAADARSPEMVSILLQAGADVNALNEGGDNALFEAVSRGETPVKIAETLLDAGLDISYVHPNYKTILAWAASCGRKEIVELLLARGADVNAQNDRNESPIAQAMMNHHHDVVKLLFAAGADPESKTYGGWSLLEYATEQKDEDLVRQIIARSDSEKPSSKKNVEARDAKSEALIKAAEKGDVEMLALLLSQGADIEGVNRWGNETALIKAAYYGKTPAVAWLLDRKAAIEARDSRGNTALQHAAWMGKRDVVELLLKKGADVNATNNLHWNALMQAALEGHHEVAKLLLENGARTDFIDTEKGASAYYLAQRSGSPETLEILKQYGAKPRDFRILKPGEAYVDIRECEYCQYIPQRKDIAKEESLGDYPGLVELHSVSTEVDRYATSTTDLFRCKLCGTYYQHDHYIDTEDDFISGPTIYRHLQRLNFVRLKTTLADYPLKAQADEFRARLPLLLAQMKETLAREGAAIHPHFLPHFIENIVDDFLLADAWQALTQDLLRHPDKKLVLQVADDLITTYGNGQYAAKGPEQDYKAYRHITPEVYEQTRKLLAQNRVAFLELLHEIALVDGYEDAAKQVIESAEYYKV